MPKRERPDRFYWVTVKHPDLDELRETLAELHANELPRAEPIPYFGIPYETPIYIEKR